MRQAVLLLCLTGCQVVFPLKDRPAPTECVHDGLELCLSFNDSSNLGRDDSPRQLDAMVSGVAQTERMTPMAETVNALDVTAENSMELPYNGAFDYPGPMSIDLWFQYPGFIPGFAQTIMDNSIQYGVSLRPDINMVDCYAALFVDGRTPEELRFRGSFVEVEVNRWNHLTCVMDVENLIWKAYLNGTQVIQTIPLEPGETLFVEGTDFLALGNPGSPPVNPPPHKPYVGQLDNVRIWNRVLSDDEIARFASGDESVP